DRRISAFGSVEVRLGVNSVRAVKEAEPQGDTDASSFGKALGLALRVEHGSRVGRGLERYVLVDPGVAAVRIGRRERLLHVASGSRSKRRVDEVPRTLRSDSAVLAPCARQPGTSYRRNLRRDVDHDLMTLDPAAHGVGIEEIDGHRRRAEPA